MVGRYDITTNGGTATGSTNYTVTFPSGTTSNDRASVRQGVVTFNIPADGTYSLTNTGTATPSLAVAEYLGHSDEAFTLRTYTHLMPTADDKARAAADTIFAVDGESGADSAEDSRYVQSLCEFAP